MNTTASPASFGMDDIRQAQRRTLAYWFVDGIPEVVGGAGIFLIGLPMYLAGVTGREDLSSLSLMVMIMVFPATASLVKAAKGRITYPRTGYVSYAPPTGRRRRISAVVSMVVAFGVAAALATSPHGSEEAIGRWFAVFAACGIGAAYVVRARRTGVMRFYGVAVLMVVLGVGIVLAHQGREASLGLLLLGLGGISMFSGAVTLVAYLRRTRSAGLAEQAEAAGTADE